LIEDDYQLITAKIEAVIDHNKNHPDYLEKVDTYKSKLREIVQEAYDKNRAKNEKYKKIIEDANAKLDQQFESLDKELSQFMEEDPEIYKELHNQTMKVTQAMSDVIMKVSGEVMGLGDGRV